MPDLPKIVFIDDHPDDLKLLVQQVEASKKVSVSLHFPDEVDMEVLMLADLVIVDFTLEDWIENVEVESLALRPMNGVALAAVLREHYRSPGLKHAPPTGFALITAKPDAISSSPGERRPHVVARLANLEWFFEKHAATSDNVQRICSLAAAVKELPRDLAKKIMSFDEFLELLGVSSENRLFERYKHAVEKCRPPLHHLSTESGGLVLLRWLLHRVLPHTCFLLNTHALAARLRVTPSSLAIELTRNSGVSEALEPFRYTGLLSDFDGQRWWRGGVEQWLWDGTEGQSTNIASIHKLMASQGAVIEPVEIERPVVTVDECLRQEESLAPWADVVALHLDDWPSYAEPAYLRRTLLEENENLKLFVVDE